MTGTGAAALVVMAAVVGLCAVHREALRRVVLGTVDPRPLALFRIALGLCLLSYVVEIAPLSTYLFSDEGLLPSEAVPQVYGRGGLDGYGDGVRAPAGFEGPGAVLRHLTHGRWSLLYFWDSPAFVRAYLGGLVLACVGLVIGWRTRACTVAVWLLLCGLLRRGDAHWGGEQVFTGLLFPLMFARSGAAFGVDAWLRRRRLAGEGRLDPCDGPTAGRGAPPSPEHPQGRAAIVPRIPAWPQVLLMAQLGLCYCANGWTKTGSTWVSGDTLRLAVHLDRYTRLDWHALAVALPSWTLQLASWSVLWWERLFPLLLVGLWLRAVDRAALPRLGARARWSARACWLVLAAALVVLASMPGALAEDPAIASRRAAAVTVGAAVIVGAVLLGGRLSPRGRRWITGVLAPRWWLGFGLAFHLTSLVLFEIGAFASATISAYLVCGAGPAAVRGVQRVARALGRRGVPVPAHLRQPRPVALEDPALP
ncbi:MAG: hypothetical protein KDK70_12040, partial [Myxococcales bacterium]|nr:hypothetical protein [Myxococcales bacterium]